MSESGYERERRLANEPRRGEREVMALAEIQLQKLAENDHKPGWKDESLGDLLELLFDEVRELEQDVLDLIVALKYGTDDEEWMEKKIRDVGRECADVNNSSTFIADVAGALEDRLAISGGERKPEPSREELHRTESHPEYEYATTRGPRKVRTWAGERPEGEGWEPNYYRGRPGEAWERFDYHEEAYWMRRRGSGGDERKDGGV